MNLKKIISTSLIVGSFTFFSNIYDFQIMPMVHAEQKSQEEQKLEKAVELRLQDKYDEAINVLNEVITMNPNSDKAYYRRGSIYYSLKKYDKALEDGLKSIEAEKNNPMGLHEPDVYRFVSKCYEKLGNKEKAREYYAKYEAYLASI